MAGRADQPLDEPCSIRRIDVTIVIDVTDRQW
jgi:hypothetical protein